MTGLVGIVAHTRDAGVPDSEMGRLTSAYESLRGTGSRHEASAGDFARVTGVSTDPRANGLSLDRGGDSWMIVAGTAQRATTSETTLETLDGQFVWSHYDSDRREFSIATDPFGMLALYLAERNGRTYLSTSALALAKHLGARPSSLGLSVYLRAGYQFGSVTNWEGIERLDPGTRVTFTRDGAVRHTYWRPTVDPAVTELSLDDAARHCTTVATETYDTYYGRAGGSSWADLTGGYDSRLMTLLLREAGIDFSVDTAGREENIDVRIAAVLARTAGWDWTRFEVPDSWPEVMPKLIPMAVGWGDCHLDALQLAEVLWGHIERARSHPGLYIGGGGEHFRSYAWQQEFLNAGRSNRVNLDNWVDMMMMRPMSTRVFVEDPTAEVRENLRARMAAYAQPYAAHLNTVQLDMLYAYKCTGHFGAYLSAATGVITPQLPFYLKEVFDAAFSTSYRHRGGHRLMRRMIERLDPRLAAIETAKGGPAQSPRLGNLHRFLPYYALIGRKAVAKLTQRLLPRPLMLAPPSSEPVRAAARGAFVNSFDDGRPLRWEGMRSRGLFRREPLDELLGRASEPGLPDAALLRRILTVELAMRATDASVE